MEQALNKEVKRLTESLEKQLHGEPFQLHMKLNVAIVNSLWGILVGETFDLEDPALKDICIQLETLISRSSPQSTFVQVLPFKSMAKFPGVTCSLLL